MNACERLPKAYIPSRCLFPYLSSLSAEQKSVVRKWRAGHREIGAGAPRDRWEEVGERQDRRTPNRIKVGASWAVGISLTLISQR